MKAPAAAAAGAKLGPEAGSQRVYLARYDDPRADLRAPIQIDDVVVGHADAARRHRLPDRVGLVRAVDLERACRRNAIARAPSGLSMPPSM